MVVVRLQNLIEPMKEASPPKKAVQAEIEPITPQGLASIAMDAGMTNGMVAGIFAGTTMGVKLDLPSLVQALSEQVSQIQNGDKANMEAMLFSQAVTLNAIFLEMARRASLNMNEHVHATEAYMRMALKAQNRVRMTLETINTLKNPPVVIAKQANISAGHQQVNNFLADSKPALDKLAKPTYKDVG